MKYSILIPTYNHCDDLLKPCIESIFKYTDMTDVELVISANGCTDNTWWYLKGLEYQFSSLGFQKHLAIAWCDQPLGFAGACNQGLEKCTGQYVVVMNNDVLLLHQDKNQWLAMFQSAFDVDSQCGISCVVKDWSVPAQNHFAVGFCIMVKKQVFDQIGLFDTSFEVGGGEDIEFSIRTQQQGWTIQEILGKDFDSSKQLYTGSVPIYHKGEATVHDTNLVDNYSKSFYANMAKLAEKYNPAWLVWYNQNRQLLETNQ